MNIGNMLFKGLEISDDHSAWLDIVNKYGYDRDVRMLENVACPKYGELWKQIDARRQGKVGWGDTYRNSCDNIGEIYLTIIRGCLYSVARKAGLDDDYVDYYDFKMYDGGRFIVHGEHIDSVEKYESVISNSNRGYLVPR